MGKKYGEKAFIAILMAVIIVLIGSPIALADNVYAAQKDVTKNIDTGQKDKIKELTDEFRGAALYYIIYKMRCDGIRKYNFSKATDRKAIVELTLGWWNWDAPKPSERWPTRRSWLPNVCAINTALVFSLNAFSKSVVSMLYSGIVMSTKTGTAP